MPSPRRRGANRTLLSTRPRSSRSTKLGLCDDRPAGVLEPPWSIVAVIRSLPPHWAGPSGIMEMTAEQYRVELWADDAGCPVAAAVRPALGPESVLSTSGWRRGRQRQHHNGATLGGSRAHSVNGNLLGNPVSVLSFGVTSRQVVQERHSH